MHDGKCWTDDGKENGELLRVSWLEAHNAFVAGTHSFQTEGHYDDYGELTGVRTILVPHAVESDYDDVDPSWVAPLERLTEAVKCDGNIHHLASELPADLLAFIIMQWMGGGHGDSRIREEPHTRRTSLEQTWWKTTSRGKRDALTMADKLGPDWAQALYHFMVLVTKLS